MRGFTLLEVIIAGITAVALFEAVRPQIYHLVAYRE